MNKYIILGIMLNLLLYAVGFALAVTALCGVVWIIGSLAELCSRMPVWVLIGILALVCSAVTVGSLS